MTTITQPKTTHTPGPWKEFEEAGCVDIIGANGDHVASLEIGVDERVTASNRDLIAAAPELLIALKRLLREIDYLVDDGTLSTDNVSANAGYRIAQQAIAKAEGR